MTVTGGGGGGKQNEDWHMAAGFDAECMMISLFQGRNHSWNSDILVVISFAVLQLSRLWCDSADFGHCSSADHCSLPG